MEQRRGRSNSPATSPADWPSPYQENSLNVERVTLSWSLVKIMGALASFTIALILVTVKINTFWYQAEIFRNDVTAQISLLNNNIRMLGDKLDTLARSPDIVRVRDLAEFCYEIERENQGKIVCPRIYSPTGKQAKRGWSVEPPATSQQPQHGMD